MATYSNGQTRYNNLLNRFNNPNVSQDDVDMYNLGYNLGNLYGNGMNRRNDGTYGNAIVGGTGSDKDVFDATNNIPNTISQANGTSTISAGSGDMQELLDLANKGKM